MQAALAQAEDASAAAAEASGSEGTGGQEDDGASGEAAEGDEGASEGGFNIFEFAASIPETVTGAAENAATEAQQTLNDYIETLSVMIVTSCVIPVLVLVFFLWLAKVILGLNVSAPLQTLAPRSFGRRR